MGTFIGLQLGLSGLNIGNDVAVEEMKSGLAEVISGAQIAFITSVWGVGLSLFYNLIEKFLERGARKKIIVLQQRIDKLFPRLTAESQLHQIAENSYESSEELKVLAEKIGSSLQTTVQEFGERIDDTIGGLVGNAGEANQAALESLLERFLGEFSAAGGNQAEEMKQANDRFANSLNSLDSSMTLLLKQLEQSQENGAKREQQLIEKVSGQVDQLIDNSKKQQTLLVDTIDKKLSELLGEFDRQGEAASQRENERNNSVTELLNRLETGLQAQLETSKQLITQGEELQESVNASIQGSIESSTRLQESASELNKASQHIKGTGHALEQAGQKLSVAITQAAGSTKDLAKENQSLVATLNNQHELLNKQQQHFSDSISQMTALFDTAEDIFEQMSEQQQNFLKRLKNTTEELSGQMLKYVNELSTEASTHIHRLNFALSRINPGSCCPAKATPVSQSSNGLYDPPNRIKYREIFDGNGTVRFG